MNIPNYYQVASNLTESEIETVLRILSFTPLDCALIQKREDAALAERLSPLVLNVEAMSSLDGRTRFAIVGDYEDPLTAVYGEERRVIQC